jgi:hypothetical protein
MGLRVGQVVGVPVGDLVVPATVLEDRGPLGAGGEQVVRLALGRDPPQRTGYRLELPASALVAPPDAPTGGAPGR